jgi:hypothetical protein
MGFASGLPLALSSATLFFWLAEAGVTLTAIGLFQQLDYLRSRVRPITSNFSGRPSSTGFRYLF